MEYERVAKVGLNMLKAAYPNAYIDLRSMEPVWNKSLQGFTPDEIAEAVQRWTSSMPSRVANLGEIREICVRNKYKPNQLAIEQTSRVPLDVARQRVSEIRAVLQKAEGSDKPNKQRRRHGPN